MFADFLLVAAFLVFASAVLWPSRWWERFVKRSKASAAARAELRRGPWSSTRTGARWYMFTPRASEIDLRDLGALAYINRFGGHARTCSVAEHLVRCAAWLAEQGHGPWIQLQGALHDAHEIAPPGDVCGPAYRGPWWISWPLRRWSRRVERVFREALGLPADLHPAVHEADLVMLSTELHDRMPAAAAQPWARKLPTPHRMRTFAWPAEYAEVRLWETLAVLATQSACREESLTCVQRTKLLQLARVAHSEAAALRRAEETEPEPFA